MNTKEKESRKIRWIKKRLEQIGFYVILSRASLGPFDLVAMNAAGVLLIQVKCNDWPDAAESETLYNFNRMPINSKKQAWVFYDGKKEPAVKDY